MTYKVGTQVKLNECIGFIAGIDSDDDYLIVFKDRPSKQCNPHMFINSISGYRENYFGTFIQKSEGWFKKYKYYTFTKRWYLNFIK